MTEVTMPQLSDQMQEGTIVSWLVEDGASVSAGDEIVEIETDKATVGHATEVDGVLRIVAPAGATLAVGEVIARIGVEAGPAPSATNGGERPEPVAASTNGDDLTERAAPEALATERRSREGVLVSSGDADHQRRATPVARRIASIHGVDLDTIDGSGPGGRVIKRDILLAAGIEVDVTPPGSNQVRAALPPAPTRSSDVDSVRGTTTIGEPTRLQQIVARRMAEAKATIPHFQVLTEVVFDAASALRSELKQAAVDDPAPSVNDLIVRACALALRQHPLVNGSYKDGHYELHQRINLGIAVDSEDGLVVVTVTDADTKSLGQITRESRGLAERVRAGTITPPELTGATFTVSNLGMFGMTQITAVINPPQAAILGVGAARAVLVRDPETGEIVDRQLLALNLSCDHRILNGADGSRFLLDVKRILEQPLLLLM